MIKGLAVNQYGARGSYGVDWGRHVYSTFAREYFGD